MTNTLINTVRSFDEICSQAQNAFESRQYEVALSSIDEALEIESENLRGRVWRGRILFQLRRFDEAEATLASLIASDPSDASAAVWHAWVAHGRGDWPEAARRWEKVRKNWPEHEDGYFGGGGAYVAVLNFDAADSVYRNGILRFPPRPHILDAFARAAHERRDWDEAANRWTVLRTIFPHELNGYVGAANSLLDAGKFEEAEATLRATPEKFKEDPRIAVTLAKSAQKQGHVLRALKLWDQVATEFPGISDGYLGAADILCQLGRLEDAQNVLLPAVRMFPSSLEVAQRNAWIAHYRKDWEESARRWQDIRQRFPQYAVGYLGGAATLQASGNLRRAEALIEEGLECFVDNFRLMMDRARFASMRHDYDEAVERFERIHALHPQEEQLYPGYASALVSAGKSKDADALLESTGRLGTSAAICFAYAQIPGSRNRIVARLNEALRSTAKEEGIHLVAVDAQIQKDGLKQWFDTALWHRSKQEITPSAAPMYGELVARILAALVGRSFKCLVLDLDNTVWGGVVGDDGVEGLVLGQGSALGEAYIAFQEYARELARRGVILAVCSKNDEVNAKEPFERHPEMVLKKEHISSFVANWNDKVHNIRLIAEQINIGVDSLVFVDDNPFERALVRQELPMVAVPEVSDDPTNFPQILADAGYFESITVTAEDRERTAQYQGNLQREALRSSTTDLPSYLRALEMKLIWRRFDDIGLARTVQLINKTNQFNLTTRRMTEEQVSALMADDRSFGLQLRLTDRFGDNGIIAIVIGKIQDGENLYIDTWLMSCRVLGRQVEPTTLNLIANQARKLGATRLIGEYIPTRKNGMVKEHYTRLGFTLESEGLEGNRLFNLDLSTFVPADTFICVEEG